MKSRRDSNRKEKVGKFKAKRAKAVLEKQKEIHNGQMDAKAKTTRAERE